MQNEEFLQDIDEPQEMLCDCCLHLRMCLQYSDGCFCPECSDKAERFDDMWENYDYNLNTD